MKILLTIILIFAVITGFMFAIEWTTNRKTLNAPNFMVGWIYGSILTFAFVGLPILFVAFIIKSIIG